MSDIGMFGSKDYDIKGLSIITSAGIKQDLDSSVVAELQIHQDLYTSCMSGKLLINDGNDIIKNIYLCGNDYLRVVIDKPGLGLPFERLFRIYKTTDRVPSTDAGQYYTIHFCSDELLSSQSILVSKAYKSAKIRDVISDILVNELGVDQSRIAKLENTSGNYDLVIPNSRPFEAIQWATSRAYDQNKFCYFFFENKNGYNLTSLQSLLKQTPNKTIKYELKNVERDPANNKDSIDRFKISRDFDMITSISNGAFSSRLLAVDIVKQTFQNYDYNLETAEAQGSLLNKYKPVNSFKNSKNETLFNSPSAFFRAYLNVTQSKSEKSNDIQYWMQKRAMHMTMLHHFRIQATLPGDITLKAGDILYFEFPSFESATLSGKKLDKTRSGKYLVTAITHKFAQDTFESIVELVSDSISEALPPAKNDINKLSKKGK